MNINWYPGHMKKTRGSIEKQLSKVDIVIELLDARAPYSSKNPILDEIIKEKPRISLLNKSDLSNPQANKIWEDFFKKSNTQSMSIVSTDKNQVNRLIKLAESMARERRVNDQEKGIINRPIRAMIVGIPNVGKSTLINTLTGRKGAKVGNRPGVTKSNQWIKTKGNLELLDTPGILWPKFEDKNVGMNLAFIGSIKDEIMDTETLALRLIEKLLLTDKELLEERYKIEITSDLGLEVMDQIALKRGCIISKGEPDYARVSGLILDEFRKGVIGKISLELPEEEDLDA